VLFRDRDIPGAATSLARAGMVISLLDDPGREAVLP
jgi:hypothetical protein